MRDKISEQRIELLHPAIRDEVYLLIDAAEKLLPENCAVRIVQGLRPFAEQAKLYAQGRTTPGKRVTNAKPGASFHQYGLSFDFALLYDMNGDGTYERLSWKVDTDWKTVVLVFEDAGYFWGGNFSKLYDAPHLEKNFGYTWRQLLEKHNADEFIPGTTYVVL